MVVESHEKHSNSLGGSEPFTNQVEAVRNSLRPDIVFTGGALNSAGEANDDDDASVRENRITAAQSMFAIASLRFLREEECGGRWYKQTEEKAQPIDNRECGCVGGEEMAKNDQHGNSGQGRSTNESDWAQTRPYICNPM